MECVPAGSAADVTSDPASWNPHADAWTALAVLLLDQWTKLLAVTHLTPERFRVIYRLGE